MVILCIDTHILHAFMSATIYLLATKKNSYCNVLNKIKAIELLYIYACKSSLFLAVLVLTQITQLSQSLSD